MGKGVTSPEADFTRKVVAPPMRLHKGRKKKGVASLQTMTAPSAESQGP